MEYFHYLIWKFVQISYFDFIPEKWTNLLAKRLSKKEEETDHVASIKWNLEISSKVPIHVAHIVWNGEEPTQCAGNENRK